VRSSRLNFLIVSDVSATYTAAIIKDLLQLQKMYSYNSYLLLIIITVNFF
jgi:hypothetical protein